MQLNISFKNVFDIVNCIESTIAKMGKACNCGNPKCDGKKPQFDVEIKIFRTADRPRSLGKTDWSTIDHIMLEKSLGWLKEKGAQTASLTRKQLPDHIPEDIVWRALPYRTKYDNKIKCGVIECTIDSVDWIKTTIQNVSRGSCRAWEKAELDDFEAGNGTQHIETESNQLTEVTPLAQMIEKPHSHRVGNNLFLL